MRDELFIISGSYLVSPDWDRTLDHLIKSQVLYHLSYGLAGAGVEARAGWVNSEPRASVAGAMRRRNGLRLPDRAGVRPAGERSVTRFAALTRRPARVLLP